MTITARVDTSRFRERMTQLSESLSGRWQVTITLPDRGQYWETLRRKRGVAVQRRGGKNAKAEPTNSEILGYLKEQDRDFLRVTDEMRTAAVRLWKRSAELLIRHHRLDLKPSFQALGEGVLAHIAQRFRRSGAAGPPDVPMRALSAAYAQRKGHNRIGTKSGRLRLALGDGKVETRRIG